MLYQGRKTEIFWYIDLALLLCLYVVDGDMTICLVSGLDGLVYFPIAEKLDPAFIYWAFIY